MILINYLGEKRGRKTFAIHWIHWMVSTTCQQRPSQRSIEKIHREDPQRRSTKKIHRENPQRKFIGHGRASYAPECIRRLMISYQLAIKCLRRRSRAIGVQLSLMIRVRSERVRSPLNHRACEKNDQILVNDLILMALMTSGESPFHRDNRMTNGDSLFWEKRYKFHEKHLFRNSERIQDHLMINCLTPKVFGFKIWTRISFQALPINQPVSSLIQLVPANFVNQFHGEQFRNNNQSLTFGTLISVINQSARLQPK